MHCSVPACFLAGVLVVKKKLFRNDVPDECGGGTVFFVSIFCFLYIEG